MAAIDAGADDVARDGDVWTVTTTPSSTFEVRQALDDAGFAIESADTPMVSDNVVPLATPDTMLGRVTAVEMVFIGASNELGAFESGAVAWFIGPVATVVLGGAATLAVAGLWMKLFPPLYRVDRLDRRLSGP